MAMSERPSFYAACTRCTAKWFGPRQSSECPRCGEPATGVRADPPWAKTEARRAKHHETRKRDGKTTGS